MDNRVGYYGRIAYHPFNALTLDILHYDNAGDRISDRGGQTDWETHFTNVGLRLALDEQTHLLAQAIVGRTVWGQPTPAGYWVDVDFASAYALITRRLASTLSAHAWTISRQPKFLYRSLNNNDEEGWATTLDYFYEINPRARLGFEFLHVRSDRLARIDQGLDPVQNQNTVQSSLRVSF